MPKPPFPKKLAFTPDIPLTQSLMAKVKDSMGFFTGKQFFMSIDKFLLLNLMLLYYSLNFQAYNFFL